MAPLDYMGRYMKTFSTTHRGRASPARRDTAQGNGLAVLGRIGKRLVGLTGTMRRYADDLYNILYRMDAHRWRRTAMRGEERVVASSRATTASVRR